MHTYIYIYKHRKSSGGTKRDGARAACKLDFCATPNLHEYGIKFGDRSRQDPRRGRHLVLSMAKELEQQVSLKPRWGSRVSQSVVEDRISRFEQLMYRALLQH